ncbi:hypothetical protein DLK05_10610 [Ancylomarina longa]|uniref:Uncharacterized protein n=1 Tax=Ancylomarina longa TaxID=2487017 RepID=A0A434AU37_9BACT|nr:hypothetical protein DLK05_10610 [Ancylomarina longa]
MLAFNFTIQAYSLPRQAKHFPAQANHIAGQACKHAPSIYNSKGKANEYNLQFYHRQTVANVRIA